MVAIGFIGLGNMGGPMAQHLVEDGHEVTVFDVDPDARDRLAEAGSKVGADAASVARQSEVVFLSLPTPEAVRHVVEGADGIVEGASEGLVLIDTTTSTAETTNEIAATLAPHGVTVLSAPVSGGASGSREGTLTTMVGGDRTTFEACKPLLAAYATDIYYVGNTPGDGHVVKLLNNYLSFLGLLGASEAVALGERAGLDAETMIEIFNESTGRNAATEDKFLDHIIPGEYDLGFTLALMYKDLRLFSQLADDNDAPVLLGDTVRNLIGYARHEFGDDADISLLYEFMVQRINHEEK